MRPVRTIAAVVFAAAVAVPGCTARTTDQTAAPMSSAPGSVTTTHPTAASTTHPTAASTGTTTSTVAIPAKATCAISPNRGPAGSRATLTCRGFASSERVDVTFAATVLTTTKATTGGEVTSSFLVPSGFAGSNVPGRMDTFQAKGRQSGKVASATFTVAVPAKAMCAISPEAGLAGSRVALTCRGFAPSEQVDVTFGAEVFTTAKATSSGEVASSFSVPGDFAGSHYPGRKDTFQAKGRQSGKFASATFTVTG